MMHLSLAAELDSHHLYICTYIQGCGKCGLIFSQWIVVLLTVFKKFISLGTLIWLEKSSSEALLWNLESFTVLYRCGKHSLFQVLLGFMLF